MRYIFLIITSLLIVVSCSYDENETFEVGSGFIPVNARIIQLDTFEIKLSTYKLDSIESTTERILVGQYNDTELGKVRAASYFQLSTSNFEISEDAELDSVALVLGYDNYYYSDTLNVNTINVHAISEDFEPYDNTFYNSNSLEFDETPITNRVYEAKPFDQDSLYIQMSFPVITNIFDAIQNEDVEDEFDLQELFPGLTIQPGSNDDGSIVGFSPESTASYLRFYYGIPNEFDSDKFTYDLEISSYDVNAASFNNIESIPIEPLEELVVQEDTVDADSANNLAYIQSGVGYMCKVEFPSIRSIIEIPNDGVVLSATLQIKPINDTNEEYLLDELAVGIIDLDNDFFSTSFSNQGNIVSLTINEVNPEFNEVIYEVDISDYITSKIKESPVLGQSLVIYDTNLNSTVNRVIVDNDSSSEYETKLIINYAVY